MKYKELEIFWTFFSYLLCIKSFNYFSFRRATDINLNSHMKNKKHVDIMFRY